MTRTSTLIAALFALAGFSSSILSAEPDSHISVKSAWARSSPPMTRNSAAYMNIANLTGRADRLLSVSSDAAEKTTLHQTSVLDGVAKMRHLMAIDLPAGKTVTFAPGGFHIMLINLNHPLKIGQEIELKLTFEKAGEKRIKVPIKMSSGMVNPGMHSKGDGH